MLPRRVVIPPEIPRIEGENMLDESQIDKLANDLIAQVDLPTCLATFEWDGQALQTAWATRQALARVGFHDTVEEYAERVHKWGFGTLVRASVRQHAAFSRSMRTLCRTWSEEPRPWDCSAALDDLIALLGIKHLGIARVSKFVCFLDQDRYAIYDSRVSYALKDLTLDGISRVFPFVGGRPVKNAQYVLADPIVSKARYATAAYIVFLRLLQRVAEKLEKSGGITDPTLRQAVGKRWTPALLEMALFMAGRDRRKTAGIRRLDTGVWDRLAASVVAPARNQSVGTLKDVAKASLT
jgi:hypothetical protein